MQSHVPGDVTVKEPQVVCKIISFRKVDFSLSWGRQAHLASNSPYGMRYWSGLLCSVSSVMWPLVLWNYFLTQLKKNPALNSHLFLPTTFSPPHPCANPLGTECIFLLCVLLVLSFCFSILTLFLFWLKSAAGKWSKVAFTEPRFAQSS